MLIRHLGASVDYLYAKPLFCHYDFLLEYLLHLYDRVLIIFLEHYDNFSSRNEIRSLESPFRFDLTADRAVF